MPKLSWVKPVSPATESSNPQPPPLRRGGKIRQKILEKLIIKKGKKMSNKLKKTVKVLASGMPIKTINNNNEDNMRTENLETENKELVAEKTIDAIDKTRSKHHFITKMENYEKYKMADELIENEISVIPIRKDCCSPAIKWKPYQFYQVDDEELLDWFYEKGYNIGGITGKESGTIIIDCDSQELYEYIYSKYDVPATTPRLKIGDRYHLFFKYEDQNKDIKTRRSNKVGIDILGEGRWHILPPVLCNGENVCSWEVAFDRENLQPIPRALIMDIEMVMWE